MKKPKLFLDMDNVIVDTIPILNKIAELPLMKHKPDQVDGIFRDLPPIVGVVTGVNDLKDYYELYIITTAPWDNPSSWEDKLLWIKQIFGKDKNNPFYKHLIITHKKNLVKQKNGILIDDRPYHGASKWLDDEVGSTWIQYGYDSRLTWENELVPFLIDVAKLQMLNNNLLPALKLANDSNTKESYKLHGSKEEFNKEQWE